LEFLASDLRKFFKVGDHVKVVSPTSVYRDETGTKNHIIVLLKS
jgi:transcription elongation factor